jgi:F420-non-reducing hydrogenase iron-sulfur subunit
MSEFQPRIIGFLCNWCSYAGADLAGVSRFQYSPNLRVIRLMCSTRVTPHIILEVLRSGADGVMVGGCHLGDCHYITGNYYTERRMKATWKFLELAGIDPRRVALYWVSASEGERFASVVDEFTGMIKELGPSPVREDEALRSRLDAAIAASQDYRTRLLNGKKYDLTTGGNVYGDMVEQDRIDELEDRAFKEDYERRLILKLTSDRPMSVKELSEKVGSDTKDILEQVTVLRGRNMIVMDSIEGITPRYRSIATGGA